jgi:hypothetical protein
VIDALSDELPSLVSEAMQAAHVSLWLRPDLPPRGTERHGMAASPDGGLMYSLSAGAGWPEALQFATRLASTVVSRSSEDRYPTLEEVIPLT